MYTLIVPAAVPFVLLATVMGLAWWEDRILPPAEPAASGTTAPAAPAAPAALPQPMGVQGPLTDIP